MYVISQILVAAADFLYVLSMLSKKKINLVILLLLSDILFACHYFCLGALTGTITIFIDAVFLLATYFIEKLGKQKYVPIAAGVAMVGVVITAAFTWAGPISLLPMFSMLIYLLGMIFTNIVFVKLGAMTRNTLNVVYMLLLASWVGAGLEVALMVSAIVGIVLNIKHKKATGENNTETEQGTDETTKKSAEQK